MITPFYLCNGLIVTLSFFYDQHILKKEKRKMTIILHHPPLIFFWFWLIWILDWVWGQPN